MFCLVVYIQTGGLQQAFFQHVCKDVHVCPVPPGFPGVETLEAAV